MMKTAMIEKEKVWFEFSALPLEAQYQVLEFMTFLHARYAQNPEMNFSHKTRFADEPFVGIWKDREDLRDSMAYVRELRQHDWSKNR